MSFDNIITSLVLIAIVMIIVLIAKKTWDICHRRIKLRHELVEHDNPAVALAPVRLSVWHRLRHRRHHERRRPRSRR